MPVGVSVATMLVLSDGLPSRSCALVQAGAEVLGELVDDGIATAQSVRLAATLDEELS